MSNISESRPKMNPVEINPLSVDQDEDLVNEQSSQEDINQVHIEDSDEAVMPVTTTSPSPRTTTSSPTSMKSELSEGSRPEKAAGQLELQPGDLAWARLGSAPFWPCIVTCNVEPKMTSRVEKSGDKEYLVQVIFFHPICMELIILKWSSIN